MNPSYFRIRMPLPDAMSRLSEWLDSPELEPPRDVAIGDAVALACDESGQWRGAALFVYCKDGWTVFEDLSGHFAAIPAETWTIFAGKESFVFAGYNDAIGYGELVVMDNGCVLREFLFDSDNPEVNVNKGYLDGSTIEPLETWIEAARFVDDDEIVFSERGLLWVHGKAV
jgi:hypothetical protein